MKYKFSEDQTLKEISSYIDKTYDAHYGDGKYQATDMIIDAGHGESFCIGNIMKYAMRYGKKDNKRAEMLKIIHYAIITIHLQDNQDD
tara:strand:- start:1624 stop:1887 length:264 start_codon:yes stop_codon:yes gene_type:complete